MNGIYLLMIAGAGILAGLMGCSSAPDKSSVARDFRPVFEKPFTATGNEPFWRIIVEHGQLVLERPALPTEELRYSTVSETGTGHRFRASRDGLSLEVVTAPQLCRDSMSGMPHPFQVRLFINGEKLAGCGGNPERLITGHKWVVDDIAGRDLAEKSRATVQFLTDGSVLGTGGCNRYKGNWSLSGETLEVEKLAVTRKACPPALMDQEHRVLDLLESARAFDISPQGGLVIFSEGGERLRASRSAQ